MSVNFVNMMKHGGKNKFYAIIFRNEANIYYGVWEEINMKFISGKSVTHKSFVDQESAKRWIESIIPPQKVSLVPTIPTTPTIPIIPKGSTFPQQRIIPRNISSFSMANNTEKKYRIDLIPNNISGSPFNVYIPNFSFDNLDSSIRMNNHNSINNNNNNLSGKFIAYTDGSFTTRVINGNKVVFGGWAYIIIQIVNSTETIIKRNSGKVIPLDTNDPTNNRAELSAIKFLLQDDLSFKISDIYSDSKYSIDCVTNWYFNWQRNGWKTSTGDDVKNRDLIEDIINLKRSLHVSFIHVRGHSGNKYNDIVDEMAKLAAFT